MSPTLQVDAIFVKDETVATKVPVVNNLKAKVPCATNHFPRYARSAFQQL